MLYLPEMVFALTADIGGTNARFQIALIEADGLVEVKYTETLSTCCFFTLQSCIETFIEGKPACELCILGIAGIVDGHEAWSGSIWPPVSYKDIKLLGFRRVLFLNDLEACGYGVMELKPEEIVLLNSGILSEPGAPKVVIAVGTGLGTCYLTSHAGEYQAWPSEGGFADFSPKSPLQEAYLHYLQ